MEKKRSAFEVLSQGSDEKGGKQKQNKARRSSGSGGKGGPAGTRAADSASVSFGYAGCPLCGKSYPRALLGSHAAGTYAFILLLYFDINAIFIVIV